MSQKKIDPEKTCKNIVTRKKKRKSGRPPTSTLEYKRLLLKELPNESMTQGLNT